MKGHTYNQIEENRECNKMSLDTFTFDKYNVIDSPIDSIISDIKLKIKKKYDEHEKWVGIHKNDHEKFKELDEIAQQSGHSLIIQMYEYIEEIGYLEDELYALNEMKIIYAFKHLEINLKKLLSASYNDSGVNKQFKWENLKQFVNSKEIDISKINGYKEVNKLREVNNFLKHTSEIEYLPIKKIIGIKSDAKINSESLEKFYSDIKKYPNVFLQSLANKIYQDLYEFDDIKLSVIAKSYALRMDERTAKNMMKKLLSLYK
ncbi:hypothetical protein Flavo103_07810 [Flavobacterium collinsii]|uniref:hypothetical protein n=1 Tax=Flavobacterium collinsii TaxID=1114861 RepID=UPI0022C66E03|nr:hypothetical protein [Flavobacterium collinsii]GIQ57645.1 hypothetical protein Flavo103_07810 [Flavobacterium collinsii]